MPALASAAVIVTPGSGYSQGDIVTVLGGTGTPAAYFLNVSAGVPKSLVQVSGGSYSVFPTGTLNVTGGAGSGLTLAALQAPTPPTTFSLPYNLPVGGTIWYAQPDGGTIVSGGHSYATPLQTCLTNASPGDVIYMLAGNTYTGNFTIPALSNPGAAWIYLLTSNVANLPPIGNRVNTTTDPNNMATILNTSVNGVCLQTVGAVLNWRIIGIKFTTNANCYPLVATGYNGNTSTYPTLLSQLPKYIHFDRCYVTAPQSVSLSVTGIGLNGYYQAVTDSVIEGIKGQDDSQAILIWNGPGPYQIKNNSLEGTSQSMLVGGVDSTITNCIPSDLEFAYNLCTKRAAWNPNDPSYDGVNGNTIKNSLELKNCVRAHIYGNTFQNVWASNAGQYAAGIVLTVRNQSGGNTWAQISDVLVENNLIQNVGFGCRISGEDNNYVSAQTQRIQIINNAFLNLNATYAGTPARAFNLTTGAPSGAGFPILDLDIEHNLFLFGPNADTSQGNDFINFDSGGTNSNVVGSFYCANNILSLGDYGISGTGTSSGSSSLNTFCANWALTGNVCINRSVDRTYSTVTQSWFNSHYATGNFIALQMVAVGFQNWAGNVYNLTAASPYASAGTDGLNPGPTNYSLIPGLGGGGGGGGGTTYNEVLFKSFMFNSYQFASFLFRGQGNAPPGSNFASPSGIIVPI